ncbi:MAG: type II toxin-antitoxin system RelE/ParE family toxin [bacterium]|nr:type II toxin-antitoxin system RelE/ParE family toxin [bacterium]
MYRIFLASSADRDYRKLPKAVRAAIDTLFEGELQRDQLSRALDVKKLKLPFQGFRVRIGSYRILFTLVEDRIEVYSIRHRKDAYR